MELIILGLGGSLGAVLSQLLEIISQRPDHAPSTIASEQTAHRRQAELRIKPRAIALRQRAAEQKRVTPREHCV
jgi:hypothetical protein